MADGTIIAKANTGSGVDAFAVDLVSGTNWPYSKIAFGASGTTTPVSTSNRLPVDIGSATVALDSATLAALETTGVSVSNFPATQPVSGSVSVSNFPATQAVTGTFWQATQPVSGSVGITGSVAVTGTFWQATQPVSGTITANAGTGTFAVSAASLPLPTGAATETTLAALNTKAPAQGQALMAASVPVAIASNQSAVPVSGTVATSTAALLTSFSQAGVIAINTVVATLDCSLYRGVSIQCVSMGTTGAIAAEWSNDNATWVAATLTTAAGTQLTQFSTGGLWTTPVMARYLRLRVATATTAGTTTLSIHQFEDRPQNWLATQPVSGTVTATVASTTVTASTPATPTTTFINSAATTNGTVIKATAGTLYGFIVNNTNAAARFLKFHNSATVTPGTTAVVLTIPVAANTAVQFEPGPMGLRFGTGICVSITGAAADTDTTAVTANDTKVAIAFI